MAADECQALFMLGGLFEASLPLYIVATFLPQPA
jgi:hypothetical protein